MADALARLVNRAMHRQPVLQPRIAAPFETATRGDDTFRGAGALPGGHDPSAGPDAPAAPNRLADAPRPSSPSDELLTEHAAPSDLAPSGAVRRPHPTIGPSSTSRPAVGVSEPSTRPIVGSRFDRPDDEAPASTGLSETRAADRNVAADQATPETRRPQDPDDQRAPTLVPITARNQRSEPARRTTPEPVIRITIGRVEVRANVAAASSSVAGRSPEQRRVMPLEEYLERRARGDGS